jgi:HSP20 family protein
VGDTLRETRELAEDARQLLAEIDRDVPGAVDVSADCRPPLDVLETTTGLEVVVDLPGVPATSLRVAVRGCTLLVAGAKLTATPDAARYHLAERAYGRFARAVRLNGAFDIARARAVTAAGQLRITLPRIEERRGHPVRIPETLE